MNTRVKRGWTAILFSIIALYSLFFTAIAQSVEI